MRDLLSQDDSKASYAKKIDKSKLKLIGMKMHEN